VKTVENVTMRDIAVLREWAHEKHFKKYIALAKRAEGHSSGRISALCRIAEMINLKQGPWS